MGERLARAAVPARALALEEGTEIFGSQQVQERNSGSEVLF